MDNITFSFGQNWQNYLSTVDSESIINAQNDIKNKIFEATGNNNFDFKDKTVLDIGCGSGIHSLAFYLLGAKQVYSFDYDTKSVDATKHFAEKAGNPKNWVVSQGNILDKEYVESLPCSEIVYAWGSLHHTGDMWRALDNACTLVNNGGLYFLSIYQRVGTYKRDLMLKKIYNKMPMPGKKLMELYQICKCMGKNLLRKENPLKWNKKVGRGMTVYHDIVDWLGGLPYEVASSDEIKNWGNKMGLSLKIMYPSKGCNVYIFQKN